MCGRLFPIILLHLRMSRSRVVLTLLRSTYYSFKSEILKLYKAYKVDEAQPTKLGDTFFLNVCSSYLFLFLVLLLLQCKVVQ